MTPPDSPKAAAPTWSRYRAQEASPAPAQGGVYPWRKADKFLLFILGNLLLLALMFAHAHVRSRAALPELQAVARTVQYLGLTDLCLFTEAPHTRHPSQIDGHGPFQSHPLALEYFPSGALFPPPK